MIETISFTEVLDWMLFSFLAGAISGSIFTIWIQYKNNQMRERKRAGERRR